MKHALNWVTGNHNGFDLCRYNLSLYSDSVQGYVALSGKFVLYSTVTINNNGNVPARDTVKILGVNDKVVGKGHESYIPKIAVDVTTKIPIKKTLVLTPKIIKFLCQVI